jgi:hypothetical protein
LSDEALAPQGGFDLAVDALELGREIGDEQF